VSEATLIDPTYKAGEPLPISEFRVWRMPRISTYWRGEFELEQPGEGDKLEASREARYHSGQGASPVTIFATDDQGTQYRYEKVMPEYDGRRGFTFSGAIRQPA
jgi:hypothetical protein